MAGSLTYTALPARLGIYISASGCNGPDGYRWNVGGSSNTDYSYSYTFVFARNGDAGRYNVCVYLTAGGTSQVYARSDLRVSYNGLPKPKPKPQPPAPPAPPAPPTQLDDVETAVTNAAAAQFGSAGYLWHVDSCREIAAGSWECIVDPDGTVPGVGEVQAVVTDVNGKYIVGPFTDAP